MQRSRSAAFALAAALWFLPARNALSVVATGGNATNDIGAYRIHIFTNTALSSNFVVTAGGNIDVLIVAGGGGGGGRYMAGGGGGGGLIYKSGLTVSTGTNLVQVGGGGAGGSGDNVRGSNGGDSSFGAYTAAGGGGGGSYNVNFTGVNGGSGGGASGYSASGGTATPAGQGNNGGPGGTYGGGGGGGAAGAGGAGSAQVGGDGGAGLSYSISGVSTYYAGGGGGAAYQSATVASGGVGGGGAGAPYQGDPVTGADNTGGGGGGANGYAPGGSGGGNGGSGIVIVRYELSTASLSVQALDATSIGRTYATLNGRLAGDGGGGATAVYFCWGFTNSGTASTGDWPNVTYAGNSWTGGQYFTTALTGLLSGSSYVYRCFATNSTGADWSDTATTFTTLAPIYVALTGDNSAGTNWTTAYQTVTQALVAATAGNVIWVAAGTYSPGLNAADSILLKSQVGLYGGFTTAMTDLNQRNWTNNETILDGSNLNYHVVQCLYRTNAILDGFTVKRGKANGSGWDIYGGGMLARGGVPIVLNCVFSNNVANNGGGSGRGGAMCTDSIVDPNAVVSNCVFASNTAAEAAGALYPLSKSPVFNRCVFRNNTCSAAYLYGGAAFAINGTFYRCEFYNNGSSANGQGGAISSGWGARVDIENCAFAGNMAANGGAIDVYHNNAARIVNCSFANNSASTRGGALYSWDGAVVSATNCIMWGNTAPTGPEIDNGATLTVAYSDVRGGWSGTSNIGVNPLFAGVNDLHLLARGGRWTSYGGEIDSADSPCIDAGDPSFGCVNEPAPNGGRINLGAYGNTDQASRKNTLQMSASDGDYTDRVRLAWASDSGATGYEIRRGTAGAYESATAVWSGTGLTWDDTSAGAGTNYYYWVRGTNGAGATSSWGGDDGRRGTIYYVRTDGSDGADGSIWGNAFASVTNALARAVVGGRVWVAAGTYTPGGNAADTFNLKPYVGLYGGFTNGMASFTERNAAANVTVLDGANVNNHVVRCANARYAVLDGFRIQRGSANGAYPDMYGGGIWISGGLPQIFNCVFTNNAAPKSSSPYGRGGAFFVDYLSVADPASAFSNCLFTLNTACEAGGAGFMYSRFPIFHRCMFRGNQTTTYTYGGALYIQYGTFRNCDFIANGTSSPATQGGAVCAGWGQEVELYNCTFLNNLAAYGAGIYEYHAGQILRIINCSFSQNSASIRGGALAMENDGTTAIAAYVTNCIMWGDSAPTGPEIYAGAGSLTVNYCDVQGGYAGTSNINANPVYADPASDLHLKSKYGRWYNSAWVNDASNSPCIDAGDPGFEFSLEPALNGNRINMGAYGNTLEASRTLSGFGTFFSFE